MKISNETKVGALVVVSIALLMLGLNFLKGKKLFSNATTFYGVYQNIQGLQNSNPILINGMQVGTVYNISPAKDMKTITVEMNITKDINIPTNSVAFIKSNPLGTSSVEIILGNATTYLKNKDTMPTVAHAGLFSEVLTKVDPLLLDVRKAITTIDTLTGNVNSVIDPAAKNNIADMLHNLNKISEALLTTTASLNILMNHQNGALAQTLKNANSITGNLAANNDKISNITSNLEKTSAKIAQLDIQSTFKTLDTAIHNFKDALNQLNNPNGTFGKLMNDPTLYQNLASTGNKLNLLLDDIRLHPKRYINISVFGKKQKNDPLLVPLPDTLNAPYYIEKAQP
ncbi:MAG TPA: MlaD family protein [Ferruginibacter sp.]|nr:MCE family protein [Bacteroidota bacterium]MBS1925866.1 MCE family protein [Bacteroidota bacterium]MCC6693780.1 MCE family protein [Chitinophagaceae bacterium]HMT95224.1 MlaD family protein [Ferruginibacter sp.]HMU23536.1 MlaD family protein [Ferruginibacter sp.]